MKLNEVVFEVPLQCLYLFGIIHANKLVKIYSFSSSNQYFNGKLFGFCLSVLEMPQLSEYSDCEINGVNQKVYERASLGFF